MPGNLDVYGYIRVSTKRQGDEGVSLEEQKAAIQRFAGSNGLVVTAWFEETQTAAKRGRPVFEKMMRQLRRGAATGVVMHKIDRSARNLRDWADLGELIDRGIRVHFAAESLDLGSRGGRLSADIQAVVAADYIRNLREEVKKGLYGRLRQGIYPFRAKLGYLNQGKGRPVAPDPLRAPLVREIFRMAASGSYTLQQMTDEVNRQGLRTREGRPVVRNMIWQMIHDPFYTGLIRIRKNGLEFEGAHEPLVSRGLYDRVQAAMSRRPTQSVRRNEMLYSRLLRCTCGRALIGETQKGRVYYRCHGRTCSVSIREDRATHLLRQALAAVSLDTRARDLLLAAGRELEPQLAFRRSEELRISRLQLQHVKTRLSRLTDAVLDHRVDQQAYQEKRSELLADRERFSATVSRLEKGTSAEDALQKLLAFVHSATGIADAFWVASPPDKREILAAASSNRTIGPESGVVELRKPYSNIAGRQEIIVGRSFQNPENSNRPSQRIERSAEPYSAAGNHGNASHFLPYAHAGDVDRTFLARLSESLLRYFMSSE